LDEVEQNIVICQWRADQLLQIIDLWDTDKSQYFAITEFNYHSVNEFVFWMNIWDFVIFTQNWSQEREKQLVSFVHEQSTSVICSQTLLDDIAHEQTIICRQLFAGDMHGGLSANEKEEIFASNDNLGPSFY